MSKYNPYQTMHHVAMYGTDTPRKGKPLWRLLYNAQVIVNRAPYAVCKAKQNELKRQSNYQSGIFKIEPCPSQ